jgi:hypothetical protein
MSDSKQITFCTLLFLLHSNASQKSRASGATTCPSQRLKTTSFLSKFLLFCWQVYFPPIFHVIFLPVSPQSLMASSTISSCISIAASPRRRRISSLPNRFLFSHPSSFANRNPSFNCLQASNAEPIQELSGSDPTCTDTLATSSQVQTGLVSHLASVSVSVFTVLFSCYKYLLRTI